MSNSEIRLSPPGATLSPVYRQNVQDVVAVPVHDIKDAASSANEETIQFTVGSFLFSGAFWLGIERFWTEGAQDALFLSCIAFIISGFPLALFGSSQARRRIRRLERYLPDKGAAPPPRDS